MIFAVIDTNVIVSAMMSRRPDSATVKVLNVAIVLQPLDFAQPHPFGLFTNDNCQKCHKSKCKFPIWDLRLVDKCVQL